MRKNRFFALTVILLLAAALAACGKTPAPAPASPDTLRVEALYTYQQILESLPALEGEHPELQDASFGYEQNREKFGNHYDRFAVYDLNQDGVPELIAQSVVNFRWTPIFIYTYTDGSAVLLKDASEVPGFATFEQNASANGAYTLFFCEENHVHSRWGGDTPAGEVTEDSAFAMEGTGLVLRDCTVGETENTVYFADIAVENSDENRAALLK